ncbi:hypothetical protein [Nodularia sphaerocarpa]|uniref:hypothetical protein n=1 Tax=Nodularia sphaerocarpa TaxID=137816 RepID=UPI001EFAE663|nr:hypothetical protein [Nodularia sphaerocarpa]
MKVVKVINQSLFRKNRRAGGKKWECIATAKEIRTSQKSKTDSASISILTFDF